MDNKRKQKISNNSSTEGEVSFFNRRQLESMVSTPQANNKLREETNNRQQLQGSPKNFNSSNSADVSKGYLDELVAIESLITKFAPVFHLHPDEKYLPCSVGWFLQRAKLIDTKTQNVIVKNGLLTPPYLHQITQQYQTSGIELRIQQEDRQGMHVSELNQNAPVYVHVKEVVNEYSHIEAIEINYISFYAYNGEYNLMGVSAFAVGHHEGDWEHVTIRCHPRTGLLLGVWYNAHRSREGSWKSANQVAVDVTSGRISVYVALNGHGTYPESGTFHRLFYVANDRTSCQGIKWIPQKFIQLQPRPKTGVSWVGPRGILQVNSRGFSVGFCGGREILNKIQTNNSKQSSTNQGGRIKISSADDNGNDFFNKQNEIKQIQIIRDPCEWQKFEGLWGTIPGPSQQDWYHTAEQPISRGYTKRVFLPLSAEVKHTQNSQFW
eukprot:TRINITY_DN467_c1_g1_i1.p1 TRINITY_DN467_c1_g1~~TRINITY_DN467_c1_g1_i1.p1  ORF type:complete len:437 (-),score=32.04 TRINITY_DN467_c1_g1_i1:393-1703(-)